MHVTGQQSPLELALTVPEARSAVTPSGRRITGRTVQEEQTKMAMRPSQSGGKTMSSTESRRWLTDGLRSTYYKCLDYRKTIHIEYTVTRKHRQMYESTVTLAMTEKDRQCGPMTSRSYFNPMTNALIGLRQEQGTENSYIPKNERTRQRPFDDRLQAKLEWLSQGWRTFFAQLSCSSSSSTKLVVT